MSQSWFTDRSLSLGDPTQLRGDLFGGLTCGIVALPLALAFGEASGAGPIAGLWGAIIVGSLAALFGGTATQVSGPTGPMVVVFSGLYASLGGEASLVFATVAAAGVLQMLFGVFNIGRYISLVPYPVVSGFMTGIGVIIVLLQASRLFGGEPESGGTLGAISAVPQAVSDWNADAVVLSIMTICIMFGWPSAWSKRVPAALAALIVGTAAGQLLSSAPMLGDIPTGFPQFVVPSISTDAAVVIAEGALILALLGSIDSLLTSLVADNMTRVRHNPQRELLGQGLGNTVAGFFGAVPGAGATMRTVVNIRSGGTTRLSGVIHSVVLVVIVLAAGPLAETIPHAVLAGILVKVGWDIIDMDFLRRSLRGPRIDFLLASAVLGLTVFVDLITAVAVGVVLAALGFVKQLADHQLDNLEVTERVDDPAEADLLARANGAITVFELDGPLSFGAAAELAHRAQGHLAPSGGCVVLDLSRAAFLDSSAARAINSLVAYADEVDVSVISAGVQPGAETALDAMGVSVERFPSRLAALEHASTLVQLAAAE